MEDDVHRPAEIHSKQPYARWPQGQLPEDVDRGILFHLTFFFCGSEQLNRKRTWERPIVLVESTLECSVLKAWL